MSQGYAADHISDVFCDNSKALETLSQGFNAVALGCCMIFLALPSRTLQLKTIQHVSEDSSAQAAEMFCSDCKWLGLTLL